MNDLKYKLSLDNNQFNRSMRSSREELGGFNKSASSRALNRFASGSNLAGRAVSSFGAAAAGAAIPIAAFTGSLALAKNILQEVAEQDSLTRALRNLEGTAAATTARLEELRAVARTPGLGFEEAIQADVRLRSVGLSADLSARSIKAFGNAVATSGGGKAQLDGVTLALTQIASKGKVTAEEINQIAERIPQLRRAMQQAFGSADTEAIQKMGITTTQFIEGIVAELEEGAKATSGAQNTLDNYSDSWKDLKNEVLDFGVEAAGGFLDSVSGMMQQARRDISRLKQEMGFVPTALRGPDVDVPSTGDTEADAAAQAEYDAAMAQRRLERANADYARRLDAEREAWEKEMAERKTRRDAGYMEDARRAKDAYLRATLSEEENLARQLADLQKAGPSGQAAIDAQQDLKTKTEIYKRTLEIREIESRLAALKKSSAESAQQQAESAAEEAASRSQVAADFATETAILQARVAGNEKLAESIERQARQERLKLEIMRQQGLDAKLAGKLAEERLKLEEQAAKPRRKGVAGAEESARRRFSRFSEEDQKKMGGFDGFVARNNTDRLAIQAERRRKAAEAGNAATAIPGKDAAKDANSPKNLEQTTAKILEKLDKIGTASV